MYTASLRSSLPPTPTISRLPISINPHERPSMPPLPPSPSAQLLTLQRHLSSIRTQLPRLLSSPSLALQAQYTSELREDLEFVTRGVRALEVVLDGEEGEGRMRAELGKMRAELDRLKKETRAAVLKSKKNLDSRNKRLELLAGAPEDLIQEKSGTSLRARSLLSRPRRSDDALTDKSNEVTLALRRTTALMQQEVERSVLSTQLLAESSRTLHSASNAYSSLSGLLGISKTLITALERADWLDRALIFAALAVFLLVVAFIFKQRVIDRGVRLAFWWVRWLPSFGDEGLDIESAAERKQKVREVLTSVLTTTSTALAAAMSMSMSMEGGKGASVRVETVTEIVTVSKFVDVESTGNSLEDGSVLPSPTLRTGTAHGVSPTEAPEPAAQEFAFIVDSFPDEAMPLEDPYTAVPPAEASPPRQRVEL
ncbi:Sec20-domain-containing protein [Dacryopinax primogenitus]|uniref:Sec20-domain-containing protein n=1 Tax=Dacryopinax primogenitus (strain DJM 731) TaxID=1858805 RepID=M5G539_DACPD|nr:Sec20-domain-containing protein [Dacryopinax primogenitus]EJU05376.1 Sec20-domain-containing protein [Dacryopinax primogenitus]